MCLLKKDQVRDFKEDQLESIASLNVHARSARQMTVYYNIFKYSGRQNGKKIHRHPSSWLAHLPKGLSRRAKWPNHAKTISWTYSI
jgi:hypothetical protein